MHDVLTGSQARGHYDVRRKSHEIPMLTLTNHHRDVVISAIGGGIGAAASGLHLAYIPIAMIIAATISHLIISNAPSD